MQLKKLSDSHYVVVTDEPIEKGDWFICSNEIHECTGTYSLKVTSYVQCKKGPCSIEVCKKVTHSTKPLEEYTYEESGEGVFGKDFFNIKSLDLSYIKSLVGEVDVEKKAEDYSEMKTLGDPFEEGFKIGKGQGYFDGYNECIEDNKHKRFSEEDMKYMFECGRNYQNNAEITFKTSLEHVTQPKDTWEVYFDSDNNLKLK